MQQRIKRLPKNLANQIAAGEVIERPQSVLKELLENSIDAGAKHIHIDIDNGGMSLIRVRDDGHGIEKDDLSLAFERHATSKIAKAQDLFEISTLGFRGEALASMSSVAHMKIISKAVGASSAFALHYPLNAKGATTPAEHPVGTTVELTDLFYNVPARRKFLKSDKTEWQHILNVFKSFVLSRPAIHFVIKHNGKRHATFTSANTTQQVEHRVTSVCSQNFINNANVIDVSYGNMRLHGWVGLQGTLRRYSDHQYIFLNGRHIKDKLINHAVRESYQQYFDLTGHYPSYILYLDVHADSVDVNVHPTKHEVRFQKATLVHDFIAKCLRAALEDNMTISSGHQSTPATSAPLTSLSVKPSTHSMVADHAVKMPESVMAAMPGINHLPRYYLLEQETELVIIDLQKALPSILKLVIEQQKNTPLSVPLLIPQTFSITQETFTKQQNTLKRLGFKFQHNTSGILVTHLPFFLTASALAKVDDMHLHRERLMELASYTCLKKLPENKLVDVMQFMIKNTPNGPWVLVTKSSFSTSSSQMEQSEQSD